MSKPTVPPQVYPRQHLHRRKMISTTATPPKPATTYPPSRPAIIDAKPIGCNLGEKRDDNGM
ncbi:hypothetical protein M0804_011511 [Polistes exclamans]|nr:hypothetical protein M0804_011511 [Polistes exclamans]